MEDEMARPNKRRRLLVANAESSPSHSDFLPEGPSPTLLHSVEQLDASPSTPVAHTVPKRIEEIHFQIQKRAVVHQKKGYQPLYPRQGATAITTLVTSINDQGQTITTEITIGATTTTPTPISTTSIASPDQTETGAGPEVESGSSTSLSQTIVNSQNGTSATTSKDSTTNHKTTPLSSVYTATLSNHHVVTITRHDEPYVTTFDGGVTSTICDLKDTQCTLRSETNSESPDVVAPGSASTSPSTVSTAYAAGTPVGGGAAPSSSSSTAAAQSSNNNDDSTPPPGTIAGGVVGGAAGLAVLLLILMMLLRWYKRRKQLGHHALPPSSTITSGPETPTSRGPGMAERAGLRPLVTAVPGFFKHQNRSDIEPPPSERSFQKVSGRKLPSAFSEGMSSADMIGSAASIPTTGHDRNYSSLSFYRDSHGFYGGEGDAGERAVSPDEVPPLQSDIQSDNGGVMLSPGPQRRPTVHTGGPWIMTPSSSVPSTPNMQSPNLATIPGSPPDGHRNINRSSTPSTVTDNRSSRFTEEV